MAPEVRFETSNTDGLSFDAKQILSICENERVLFSSNIYFVRFNPY